MSGEEVDAMGKLRSFGNKLVEYLAGIAEDVSTLTVITTTGTTKKTKKRSTGEEIYDIIETGVSAKTVIELDGDIIFKIPIRTEEGEKLEIDERILQLHEAHVKMSMDNWKTFLTTLVDISFKLLGFLR